MCSLEVLNQVRYQKQLVASRKQKYFCARSCPVDEGVRIVQKPAGIPLRGESHPNFKIFNNFVKINTSNITVGVSDVSVTFRCVPRKY